jgi:hypothetical protein
MPFPSPIRDQVGLETPLRLGMAAALAFAAGSGTASGPRGDAALVSASSTRRVMAGNYRVP